mgnify:CR=1 FL=1
MPAIEIPTFIPATDDLFVYGQQAGVAQPGATTQAMIQEFMRNNSDVLKCLVQSLWQPQVQYAANQVVWSPNMGPNLWAKVKTAGTTLGTEPVWSELVGAEVTDGTVVYTMCEIIPTLPVTVGSINVNNNYLMTIIYTDEDQETVQLVKTVNGNAPDGTGNITLPVEGILVGDVVYRPYLADGYVKANGATVSRSDYPNLVTFANEKSLWTTNPSGEPWKYGTGDGSTTMVLPDFRNRFIEGSDGTSIIAAGLPNITGSLKFMSYGQSASGAFTFSSDGSQSPASGNWYSGVFNFNASRSSSIYGASTTVQPSAIALIAQIKY